LFESRFKVEISYSRGDQCQRFDIYFSTVCKTVCFKQDMEEFSKMCEQSSNDNYHIGVYEIDGNDEHILKLSDLIRVQRCHFEVSGN